MHASALANLPSLYDVLVHVKVHHDRFGGSQLLTNLGEAALHAWFVGHSGRSLFYIFYFGGAETSWKVVICLRF